MLQAIYSTADLLHIFEAEHALHPLAEAQDYCKLYFQAYFGQGHFVGSRSDVELYLKKELATMQEDYLPLMQDISNGSGLYRVSLSVLKQNVLSMEEFADRFC